MSLRSRPRVVWSRIVSSRGVAALGVLTALVLAPGCGGGAPSEHIERPVVRWFSPNMSPINFGSSALTQNPTETNGFLTTNTADPTLAQLEYRDAGNNTVIVPPNTLPPPGLSSYGPFGRIVIYFEPGTVLDPQSILSDDPLEPLDQASLLVAKYTPNFGITVIKIGEIIIEPTRIVLKPLSFSNQGLDGLPTPLPNGQYTVRLSANVTNTDGDRMFPAPVFHTFTVGADSVRPLVVNTLPGAGQIDVGAGVAPPPPPGGVSSSDIADVRTNIFGPTSPDVVIEFNEQMRATRINENNIQGIRAGQGGYPLPVSPGYPKLKSEIDGDTLPSNGHEAVWQADPAVGGLPFQSAIQMTIVGSWNNLPAQLASPLIPNNASPVSDLTGNGLEFSYVFTFFTVAPPDVPQNPFPEYAIWWAASERIGALDTVNQQARADAFNGVAFPQGIPRNVIPTFTDTITNSVNVPGFVPGEMLFDQRTSAALCHSYIYVLSPDASQIVIVNTRTSLPVALINTPTPGGLAGQFSPDGVNTLVVTNKSANTVTFFDFSNITPGTAFLNGPIFITRVLPAGNTPTAVSMSDSAGGLAFPADWNRDGGLTGGPPTPLVMWIERASGVLRTYNLGSDTPSQAIALGNTSQPTDIVMTPCFPAGGGPILFAAISQTGTSSATEGGKVAYYVAGPGCVTGSATGGRPDSIVGDLSGFAGPTGLDEVLSASQGAVFFVVAESSGKRVATLGLQVGANNLPRVINRFTSVGDGPSSICHRPAWQNPCVAQALNLVNECAHDQTPSCHYNGTEQDAVVFNLIDGVETVSQSLYICAAGAQQITVVNMLSGGKDAYSPIPIQGLTRVASTCSQ